MKKNWIYLLIFIGFTVTLRAQYLTPGTGIAWGLDDLVNNSTGAVTQVGNEYFINNDLVVSLQDTIRITENATVKFHSGSLITVLGVFLAHPPDSILFTSVDTLDTYRSFRFEDSDASELKRCRIEFGGGMDVVDSDVLIEDCTFWKNDKSNSTGVIDLFYSNAAIINCWFYYNQGPAVLSGANAESSPLIRGNFLFRNNTMNTNMPQINLGTSSPGIPIRIIGNTIEGFYDKAGGIAVATLAGGTINCLIDSNLIINNRYGITAYGFDITSIISNNHIYDNNIENLPMQGGSGINYWGGTSNTSLVYGNEIRGNLWGITITGDALPNIGQVEPDTVNPGRNSIHDNGNLGVEYALYNNSPNPIFAENNFWGYYNLDSVEMVIFHYPDDETLGFVDYLPIMDSLTTMVNPLAHQKECSLFPNPADAYITIQRPTGLDDKKALNIRIFNATGREIETNFFNSSTVKLDISGWDPGIYLVEISDGLEKFTSRFMKY